MRTSALFLLAVLAATSAAAPAIAAESGFERRVVLAAGGGYPATSGGVFLAARLRYLPKVPFALELNLYAPYGFGIAFPLDVYRGDRLRVHAFDLGVFENMPWAKVSHSEVDRFFDVTIGCGVEWNVYGKHVVSVDWRAFLADPTKVPFNYGNYALKLYKEALIGGQLWLGYVFVLD